MYDYEEACPVSRAASVLCERWTLQIIREMLLGATRFSEFQNYLPRMSPTLLNTRLRTLEKQGIIVRKKKADKRGYEYQLTSCGRQLGPVIKEMGKWGIRWVFDSMNPEQLNLSAIIRDYAIALNTDQLPAGDTTIQFTVTNVDVVVKRFVLVRDGAAQVCEENISNDVDVFITATLETLGKIWFGELNMLSAQKQGLLKVVAAPFYMNNLSKWLGTSQFAPYNNHNSDS